MHIEYLDEFIELAQCLNFTEAARRSNITQSSLSKHILALEKELGAQLLKRDKHTVALTQAGHLFLQEALEITSRYRLAKQRIAKAGTLPNLRIGGLLQNQKVLWSISSVLTANEQEGINFSCSYHQVFSKPFFDLLADKDIDILFTYQDALQKQKHANRFESKHLFDDPFVAVMDADHHLSKKSSLKMNDLEEERLIHLSGAYHSLGWDHIELVCQNHGFKPIERSAFVQPELGYSFVDPKKDILILSQSSLTGQLFARAESYACLPIVDEDAHFSIQAVYRKDDPNITLQIFGEQLERVIATS